jgi:hypothetical protein
MENISEEEHRAIARKLGAHGGAAKAARRSPEERSAEMRERVGQFWAKLSPEERSVEMRRRAAKRKSGRQEASGIVAKTRGQQL